MEFVQILFLAVYFGTPVFIVYCWIRLKKRNPRRVAGLMLAALGLWLLQAGVLLYFLLICISGHCRLTKVEELGPLMLMGLAYAGIGALLWLASRLR